MYNWMMRASRSKYALYVLAVISFVESSFFPIPPDILLIPMVLAARQKAWLIAGVCTIASVIGGWFGYAIGMFLYDVVALPILEFYGYVAKFDEFRQYYNDWGAWIVFGAGITPFPYKVITIASGVTGLDIWTFSIASILARGFRFFLIAALLWKYGKKMEDFIVKNIGWLSILFFMLLFGGFVLVKYVL
jgi:membrane protein YqaA with SNARE-associated domain